MLSLGELAVLPAAYAPSAVAVSNLSTTSVLGEEKGDIRVTWDYSYNSDFDHFDIYTETADGTRKLVVQTRGEGFYIPPFTRNANDAYVNVLVVPVMKDMRQQPAQTLQVKYPAAAAPTVTYRQAHRMEVDSSGRAGTCGGRADRQQDNREGLEGRTP